MEINYFAWAGLGVMSFFYVRERLRARARARARRPKTQEQAMAEVMTTVEALMVELGEAVLPILEDVMETLTDLLREFEWKRQG